MPIIRTLIDAGLSGDVAIAFQTTDDDTLDIISRSNIKIETYDQLARTFGPTASRSSPTS